MSTLPRKISLIELPDGGYFDVMGGNEPYFSKHIENGQIVYWHQSGYGCLGEDRVTVIKRPQSTI